RPALPDADAKSVRSVDRDELDVRSVREAWVPFDERAEAQKVRALGLAANHRVRVADGDRRQLELLAVDVESLARADLDRADVHADARRVEHRRAHLARTDAQAHLVDAGAAREPA